MARISLVVAVAGLIPVSALAQTPQPPVGPVQLPTVTVTAQKEPADAQTLPLSLTTVSKSTIDVAGIEVVSDAGLYAPNTYFPDFTARKLTNPRFRGVGSSPANPGVATYIDGVPQLNASSSSVSLLDVEQIELVRGPQSALFGKNALGGLINITSARPSLTQWTGAVSAPFGSRGERALRGNVSGPLKSGTLALGLALEYGRREGFTKNDITGHDLDFREGVSGKAQLLWAPRGAWQARLIVAGERDRDGDYALNDLGALRKNPFHAARDFEGHTDRDVWSTTIETRRSGQRVGLSTSTGVVRWKTRDLTDLDYTPQALLTRDNTEAATQFTQEIRFASAANTPATLWAGVPVRWQAGAFFSTQSYDQDAVNRFAPFVLSPFLAFPVSQHSPQSTLDDVGVGVYGQATATLAGRLDLSAGARLDHENKQATLKTFFAPAVAPDNDVAGDKTFTDVSPQVSLAMRVHPGHMVYASVGRGFKAGGFNPASPAGSEAYGQEHAWHAEGGLKSSLADGRVSVHAAVFSIEWHDLQLNLPNPAVPGQFYIANVGGAVSRGVEWEMTSRPRPGVDLFGSAGLDHGRFSAGSVSSGVNVSGKKLPSTPEYNASMGIQIAHDRPGGGIYGRADMALYGAFQYDDANTAGQDAYSLANFRAGVRRGSVLVEAWVRNAFDTRYVPVAFAYGPLAPSGFVGEPGRPRTVGVTVKLRIGN